MLSWNLGYAQLHLMASFFPINPAPSSFYPTLVSVVPILSIGFLMFHNLELNGFVEGGMEAVKETLSAESKNVSRAQKRELFRGVDLDGFQISWTWPLHSSQNQITLNTKADVIMCWDSNTTLTSAKQALEQ